jgi:hypothetical protein
MSKKEIEKKMAEELCKLANERFGLEMLCECLLSDSGFSDCEIKKAVNLAKQRKFVELCAFMETDKL